MTHTTPTERLYSIPTAAELLDVNRATIYRLIRAGRLPHVDISLTGTRRRMRIRATDLHEFIQKAGHR